VDQFGLSQRLSFYPGDFFAGPLPSAEVLVMGRILHNWDIPTRKLLIKKAYRALPAGGALIVYDPLIADAPWRCAWAAVEPEHAHRNKRRLGIHRSRMHRLAPERRLR
jgi:hypothetical protein